MPQPTVKRPQRIVLAVGYYPTGDTYPVIQVDEDGKLVITLG